MGLAYLHIIEGETGGARAPEGAVHFDYAALRKQFKGTWMVNNGYTRSEGMDTVAIGAADLIAYGRPFISNPDLVRRFSENAPLNELQADKLYGGGLEGYTDYPVMQIVH